MMAIGDGQMTRHLRCITDHG
uniref:Uncharacterized protein n=1 Tax=Arundo donax TaxID=35708 RepID=A0A0A9A5X1_ARUDO